MPGGMDEAILADTLRRMKETYGDDAVGHQEVRDEEEAEAVEDMLGWGLPHGEPPPA